MPRRPRLLRKNPMERPLQVIAVLFMLSGVAGGFRLLGQLFLDGRVDLFHAVELLLLPIGVGLWWRHELAFLAGRCAVWACLGVMFVGLFEWRAEGVRWSAGDANDGSASVSEVEAGLYVADHVTELPFVLLFLTLSLAYLYADMVLRSPRIRELLRHRLKTLGQDPALGADRDEQRRAG